jgi:hypothetical protein
MPNRKLMMTFEDFQKGLHGKIISLGKNDKGETIISSNKNTYSEKYGKYAGHFVWHDIWHKKIKMPEFWICLAICILCIYFIATSSGTMITLFYGSLNLFIPKATWILFLSVIFLVSGASIFLMLFGDRI